MLRAIQYVIGVTGSSGKGTTTNLIYNILKNAGMDVVYNDSGSNGIRAITTLILNNCTIFGRFKHEVLLLELDEKHLHLAFRKNKMTHLVITNITRDQPARNGSPDLVFKSIMNALDGKTTLIINGDDPGLKKICLSYKGKVITYGIDKTKDSYVEPKYLSIDNAYCPNCHQKLKYIYYHYGHLGNYQCPKCSFKRDPLDYIGKNLDLDNQEITINDNVIHLNKNILYTAYATVASYALAKTININDKVIKETFNIKHVASKRAHEYWIDNRPLIMLESKNENSLSYFQSLQYIKNAPHKKTVVLGFDNVSRRYKYNAFSWLWDVDFELLNDDTRLNYANINKNKLIFIDDLNDLIKIIKNKTIGDIYTMVCFDMTEIILNLLKEEKHHENI